MTTKIVKPVRREVCLNGVPHTVLLTPNGVYISLKGYKRKRFVSWQVLATPDLPITIITVEPSQRKEA